MQRVPRGSIRITIYSAPKRMPHISSRLVTMGVGAVMSVLLHALIFTSALWGAGSSASRPPIRLADVVSDTPGQDQEAMQWILLDQIPPTDRPEKGGDTPFINASKAQPSADALAALSAVPDIVLGSPDQHQEQEATDDSDNRSALYGRYIGQINARVIRAWLRPRTPIGSSTFNCRARIEQDTMGIVKEVTLEACNGDARWQLSVVHAIEAASPLPAAPEPRMFRQMVTIPFESEGYVAGSSSKDDFEPVAAQ